MTATSLAPPPKPLRAYSVQETEEMTGGIIFARHAITARKWGANEFANGEIGYVTCRRAPWADEFAETGAVPARVAVHHRWNFECNGCGRRITEDGTEVENEAGEVVDVRPADCAIGSMHGAVYCCAECESAYLANEAAKKAFGAEVLERLREWVRARLGPVKFAAGAFQEHVYVTGGYGEPLNAEQACVSFDFPGQDIGAATVRWEEDRTRKVRVGPRWLTPLGPWKPAFSVCNGDRRAFEAFVASKRMIRGMSAATALAPSLSGRTV